MHVISGDLWAGAESQAFTLLKHLATEVKLHVILMNEGELSRRLQKLDIQVTVLDESKLSSLKILFGLIKIIRKFNPDILHTHRQKENILGNFANLLGTPLFKPRARSVRTTHGAPESTPKGKQKIQVFVDKFVGLLLQQAVIAVSTDLGEKLKDIYPAAKIHIIHNGVDSPALLSNAEAADFLLQAPNDTHIGIIGRIEPVKRIDIFIDMANILLSTTEPTGKLKFHIIGDGSLRSSMEAMAVQLGLSQDIFFHGHRSDIASCISSLDVIVMCSDHEGTPMLALEALALGTPLIAHNTGGLKNILADYPELLITNHTPQGYSDGLQKLRLNNNIEIKLTEQYSATSNKSQTLALYKSLIC